MTKLADASINSLPSTAMQAGFVPPSEQLITLTYKQLQELIINAVTKAIEPLQDEVSQLQATVAAQNEKIAALESRANQQEDNGLIQLRLIHGLKEEIHKETTTTATETERIERIEKLCQDSPGHVISLSELRGRMEIDKAVLSRLLKKIDREKFYLRKSSMDKRIRYLCRRPEVR